MLPSLDHSPSLHPQDELPLAARIVAGEHGAFEQLMRLYNRRLFRLARATLRDDAEAEDALQEAYLEAYRGMASFRGEASLATWLSRLVLNACLGRLRRNTRRNNIIPMAPTADSDLDSCPGDPADAPDLAAGRGEMRGLLQRKIDELPDVFRVAFVLRAVEELTVEETAASLGIPEATVRSRLFRARSMLRESLARDVDLAERDAFNFDGERCDRIVHAVLSRVTTR
ncbi:MAG: RNA polymerase sigma factor [Casimicrobiaceae bacterium]